jgi:GNAT superfamily N-acetyltransferase
MTITNFTTAHLSQAFRIAKQCYDGERTFVPALPPVGAVPDLTRFAENGLGVAAFNGDTMLGFLCAVSPFQNAFRSTDATGVFSPMGANGAAGENRAEIYARMYQAAGEKWARAGAASHAVCLYAHDKEAQEQFFRYGFGMRTVDGIRGMEDAAAPMCAGYEFAELTPEDFPALLPLDHRLDAHMAASPCFILRPSLTESAFIEKAAKSHARYFAAKLGGKPVAFLKIARDGETFIQDMPGYLHICGAYCLPGHRGKGVYTNLLNLAIRTLRGEGYTRLGVDFESINPTAYGFWPKHFAIYTHGVTRRIDEHSITAPIL